MILNCDMLRLPALPNWEIAGYAAFGGKASLHFKFNGKKERL